MIMSVGVMRSFKKNQAVMKNKQFEMIQLQAALQDCTPTEAGNQLKKVIKDQAKCVMEEYQNTKKYVDDVVETIKTLNDENMIQVLLFRYVDNMEWVEVAEKLHFSKQWCRVLHDKAIHLLGWEGEEF